MNGLRYLTTTTIAAGLLFGFGQVASAASVYGALYQTANLVAADATNKESVVTYLPGTDGFIAITHNDAGAEWWTSDSLGVTWTRSENNPLADYHCTQIGRHSTVITSDASYFGAGCTGGSFVFKITGLEQVEVVFELASTGPGYPTALLDGETIYMFHDGGFTSCFSDVCTDTTTAINQPASVPLEGVVEPDGTMVLPFTDGTVQLFDGTTYTQIGDNFLEAESVVCDPSRCNLPAVGILNDTIYVGNQDVDNGASIFQYDPTDSDGDGVLWETAVQLGSDDTIVNKMQKSQSIDGSSYLVSYTANGTTGTNIIALDKDGNTISLVDSGLGGENPTNNSEVVSIVNRKIQDAGQTKDIMLFATQNPTDNTKIFVLNLASDLAVNVSADNIVTTTASRFTQGVNQTKTIISKGTALKIKILKSQVHKGDVFSLWVNGEKVDTFKATSVKSLTLTYSGAKNLPSGTNLKVKVGVKRAYGSGSNQVVSENVILGEKTTVKIK